MSAALVLNSAVAVGTPDLSFSGDTDTGIYRIAANNFGLACAGAKVVDVATTGVAVTGTFSVSSNLSVTGNAAVTGNLAVTGTTGALKMTGTISENTADTALSLAGNRAAGSTGDADVKIGSTATRTAGGILDVVNNATTKFTVDFSGQIKWPSGPASTSTTPAPSAVTAITPNAHWTAADSLAYWKDPFNVVHIKGRCSPDGAGANPAFTLPAGFRPSTGGDARKFPCGTSTAGTVRLVSISDAGDVSMDAITAATVWLDGIAFLAEA